MTVKNILAQGLIMNWI